MILKQNCFVISETELQHLEEDTYISPAKSFTGSSLSRRQNKGTDFTYKASKEREQFSNSSNLTPFCQQWKSAIELNRFFDKRDKKENVDHSLSAHSKTKIRNKIIAWSNCIPKGQKIKFTFTTLTLTSSQIGTDKDFTKMQNTLFTYLRKYYGFKRYMYVLEKQANGNIHSHILSSQFMPPIINKIWCKILSENGYTFNFIDWKTGISEILTPLECLSRYASSGKYDGKYGAYSSVRDRKVHYPKKNCNVPSPVDFSVVHDLKSVSKYVTKYITKNTTVMQTNIWNCSTWVSRLWTGANICAKTHYLALQRFTVGKYEKILDNGYKMSVYLLRYYTQLQKSIFSQINKYELNAT